jgi:uncharacterized protein (UPF0332 family)
MSDDFKDYVSYRLARSKDTFQDARILAEANSWNSCVNRLYYSCFYAVTALLISKGFEAKTHNGVKTIFFKEFIATGLLTKDSGNLYSDLLDWRSESDYADFVDYDDGSVSPMIDKVKEFLTQIEALINA